MATMAFVTEGALAAAEYTGKSIALTGTPNLLVAIFSNTGGVPSSVTWNGDALTQAASVSDGSSYWCNVWYIVNPDIGTYNLVWNAASNGQFFSATNVNTTTPIAGTNSATANGDNVSVSVSGASSDRCEAWAGGASAGSGNTLANLNNLSQLYAGGRTATGRAFNDGAGWYGHGETTCYEGHGIVGVVFNNKTTTAYTQGVAGAQTNTGSLLRGAAKVFAGAVTMAGAILRYLPRMTIGGAITFVGGYIKVISMENLEGSLALSGSTVRMAGIVRAGALALSGSVSRFIDLASTFAGEFTSSGALARQAQRIFAGALTFSSTLVRDTAKILLGALGLVGSLAKMTSKFFVGVLTFIGALPRYFITPIPALHARKGISITHGVEHVKRVHAPRADDKMHTPGKDYSGGAYGGG